MFSSRLKWDLRPNPLSVLLAEKRRSGARILDLTESNPTRAGIDYPNREILESLTDPASLRYDPSPIGLLSARESVARYYADRGVAVDPSQILLTASTSEAYSYLFKLLTDPGDEILVPRPSYPLYEFLAGLEFVDIGQYPLRYDGVWHIDFESLEKAVTAKTKAIVVVNPNNPTGSFIKRDEAQRLQNLGIPILSDEVFSDYAFDIPPLAHARGSTTISEPRPSGSGYGNLFNLAPAEGSNVPTFCMSGLSKIAGLPQMKLGWIVATGPGHEAALERLEWIADTYLSVATPIQVALPRILDLACGIREQIWNRTTANLNLLREQSVGSPANVLQVEGGWYAILQVPSTHSEEEWTTNLLRNNDVLAQPGFFYDFESEAYLVLSLLTEPGTFREGVRRISQALLS